MLKRKHYKALKYIDNIPDIIANPDYVGINPNEEDISLEYVKKYKENILLGIKLDISGDYLYVSTMHELSENKIPRRLHAGRLKKV